MLIRNTLASTQAATFSISLPDPSRNDIPRATGTGFFVSGDGLFVTARHVIEDSSRMPRSDINQGWLQKEMRAWNEGPHVCQWPELVFEDAETDIAVLRVDFDRNAEKHWLQTRTAFPHVTVSRRLLAEGEPVYAFGYPLPESQVFESDPGLTMATETLYPRVTSAIVASTRAGFGPVQSSSDATMYVLDKALNYGNSGGPIAATETGRVHAVCTAFHPVGIEQRHILDAQGNPIVVSIPSLYGFVSSLGNRAIVDFLAAEGVPVAED